MNTVGSFPLITMGAMLMTLGMATIFLLYRYLKTLQKEHRHFSHIIRNAPSALCWFNDSGRILGANNAFLALTGYDASDLKGQEWLSRLLPDEEATRLRHRLKISSMDIRAYPAVMIKADGSWISVVLDISNGKKVGIVSMRMRGNQMPRKVEAV